MDDKPEYVDNVQDMVDRLRELWRKALRCNGESEDGYPPALNIPYGENPNTLYRHAVLLEDIHDAIVKLFALAPVRDAFSRPQVECCPGDPSNRQRDDALSVAAARAGLDGFPPPTWLTKLNAPWLAAAKALLTELEEQFGVNPCPRIRCPRCPDEWYGDTAPWHIDTYNVGPAEVIVSGFEALDDAMECICAWRPYGSGEYADHCLWDGRMVRGTECSWWHVEHNPPSVVARRVMTGLFGEKYWVVVRLSNSVLPYDGHGMREDAGAAWRLDFYSNTESVGGAFNEVYAWRGCKGYVAPYDYQSGSDLALNDTPYGTYHRLPTTWGCSDGPDSMTVHPSDRLLFCDPEYADWVHTISSTSLNGYGGLDTADSAESGVLPRYSDPYDFRGQIVRTSNERIQTGPDEWDETSGSSSGERRLWENPSPCAGIEWSTTDWEALTTLLCPVSGGCWTQIHEQPGLRFTSSGCQSGSCEQSGGSFYKSTYEMIESSGDGDPGWTMYNYVSNEQAWTWHSPCPDEEEAP